MKTQSPQFGIRTGISWATRVHRAGPTPLEYQSVNARFGNPEIQEVSRDRLSGPIIVAETIKRKCYALFQSRSRVRDEKEFLVHVNVFGSNAPDELVLARNSFVRGIPLSGSLGLKIIS